MMMAELPLGLSMILGGKAVPLAHLLNWIDERPISMMMTEFPLGLSMIMGNAVGARPIPMIIVRSPSWVLHDDGKKKGCAASHTLWNCLPAPPELIVGRSPLVFGSPLHRVFGYVSSGSSCSPLARDLGSFFSSSSSVSACSPSARDSGCSTWFTLLVRHLRLDGSSDSVSRRLAPSRRQLRLAMRSISMQFRQLLLVGQLRLDGSSESGLITSDTVLSKTAIFPGMREGNVA